MAFLLSSERPAVAALSGNPLGGFWRWVAKARTAHSQRIALAALLEFDEHRLDDLGISRQDVADAIRHPVANGDGLARHRAQSAKAWTRS